MAIYIRLIFVTWGVLDRLLDDPTNDIVGVTGTSAGAMIRRDRDSGNGAVLVDGLVRGGPSQARAQLRRHWEAVGAMPGFGSFFSGMAGEEAANKPLESIPTYVESMKKNLSPCDISPSDNDPTRLLLTEMIDFDRLHLQEEIQLTVCATNARTARRRVFTNQDVSVDALMASAACHSSFGPSRSTASHIGTALSRAQLKLLPGKKIELILEPIDQE